MTDQRMGKQQFFQFEEFASAPEADGAGETEVELTDSSVNSPSDAELHDNVEDSIVANLESSESSVNSEWSDFRLSQAVLAHLAKSGATGMALHVPTRIKKFPADAAAYWSDAEKRINHIRRTVLVNVCSSREACWGEAVYDEAFQQKLAALKAEQEDLEALLRLTDPDVKASDELFSEFQSYDYSQSRNRKYRRVCQAIRNLQHSLFKGGRLEQLCRADVADELYLAVPENLIDPAALPEGWGLWFVKNDGSIFEVKPAIPRHCPEQNRQHLVQNIGAAARKSILFANGIRLLADGAVRFCRAPRARRK